MLYSITNQSIDCGSPTVSQTSRTSTVKKEGDENFTGDLILLFDAAKCLSLIYVLERLIRNTDWHPSKVRTFDMAGALGPLQYFGRRFQKFNVEDAHVMVRQLVVD
jgi:hypothetical protein